MRVPSAGSYESRSARGFRVRKADKSCDSPQLELTVFKEEIVLSQKTFLGGSRLHDSAIVNLPESHSERIGGSIAGAHRMRNLQRVAHNHDCFQSWQNALPKGQCETVTRVFPSPRARTIEFAD